eukprot:1243951-Amphidinium_carterae.1
MMLVVHDHIFVCMSACSHDSGRPCLGNVHHGSGGQLDAGLFHYGTVNLAKMATKAYAQSA